jgi:hypothetical protein
MNINESGSRGSIMEFYFSVSRSIDALRLTRIKLAATPARHLYRYLEEIVTKHHNDNATNSEGDLFKVQRSTYYYIGGQNNCYCFKKHGMYNRLKDCLRKG